MIPEPLGAIFDALSDLGQNPSEPDGLAALDRAIGAAFPEGHEPGPVAPAQARAVHRLGGLSERYESGGRGPGTVSSGRDDPGGVSYGLYQLATRPGTVAAFVAAEGSRWADEFAGKAPGGAGFTAAWQGIAAREPEPFGAAQHGFIERTHYRPAVAGVRAQAGIDLDRRADAVRDACWSTAVQHGAAIRLLCEAVGRADGTQARTAPGYDRALLRAIYGVRADYLRRLAGRLGRAESASLSGIAARRYPAELAAAEAMLAGAG